MLVIHNQKLAEKLERIARRNNESVEEVIGRIADELEPEPFALPSPEEMLEQISSRLFGAARGYWLRVGDTARLQLSDEELESQLIGIDADGVPLLVGDPGWDTPTPGTGAAAALAAHAADLHFGREDSAMKSREILENEFGLSPAADENAR